MKFLLEKYYTNCISKLKFANLNEKWCWKSRFYISVYEFRILRFLTCRVADNCEIFDAAGAECPQQILWDAADAKAAHEQAGAILDVLHIKN